MLSKDAKQQCVEAQNIDIHSTLDPYLQSKNTIVTYSESSFHAAVIQWLIETDQMSIFFT